MNVISLVGRLTRDPEVRYTAQGHPVASFTLAVDREFKNAAGQREADFIPVIAWRALAENVAKYVAKGREVRIVGRLQVRSYEPKDTPGTRRYISEVVADKIGFGAKPKDNGNGNGHAAPAEVPAAAQPEPDEDVLF